MSGLYFTHPEARYFALGKIGKEQVGDYERCKGSIQPALALQARAQPSFTQAPVRAQGSLAPAGSQVAVLAALGRESEIRLAQETLDFP